MCLLGARTFSPIAPFIIFSLLNGLGVQPSGFLFTSWSVGEGFSASHFAGFQWKAHYNFYRSYPQKIEKIDIFYYFYRNGLKTTSSPLLIFFITCLQPYFLTCSAIVLLSSHSSSKLDFFLCINATLLVTTPIIELEKFFVYFKIFN